MGQAAYIAHILNGYVILPAIDGDFELALHGFLCPP